MKRALAVVLPVLLLTGCASNADSAYLSTVRESIPALGDVSDADLTGLGHRVCDTFTDRGFTDGMVLVVKLAKDNGMTASEAGVIAGAASAAYCSEFSGNFG